MAAEERTCSIPVVQAMLGKGAALGTVLAFMMNVIALSLPEMVILRKVLEPRLIPHGRPAKEPPVPPPRPRTPRAIG